MGTEEDFGSGGFHVVKLSEFFGGYLFARVCRSFGFYFYILS